MKKKKLSFAIVGCGSVSIDHAKMITKLGHKVILGSTKKKNSKNWKLFKKKFPSVKFASIDQILNSNNVDMVITCLPLDEQKKNCKKILCSKKPILIEKPLHNDDKVLKKILSSKKTFLKNKAIAYNRRNYEIVKKIKKEIKLKKIKLVEVNISENINYLKKKYKKDLIKKFLHVGSSSHIFDLFYYLFGNLKILKKWIHKNSNKFSISLVLITNKNFPIFVKINPSDSENPSIKIRFEDNYTWMLSPIEKLVIYKGNKIIKSNNNYFKKDYVPNAVFSKREQKNLRPGFLNQIKNFANQNFETLCKVEENYKLIKLFNQIR